MSQSDAKRQNCETHYTISWVWIPQLISQMSQSDAKRQNCETNFTISWVWIPLISANLWPSSWVKPFSRVHAYRLFGPLENLEKFGIAITILELLTVQDDDINGVVSDILHYDTTIAAPLP